MKMTAEEFESYVEKAAEEAKSILRSNSIAEDVADFKVKIKEFNSAHKSNHWLALYRGGTAFIGGRAIFWINEKFVDILIETLAPDTKEELLMRLYEALIDTMLHEAAHAVCDVSRFKGRYLNKESIIIESAIGDEETFAESMVGVFKANGFESLAICGLYHEILPQNE
jgi:hypothetical protein